MEAWIRHTIKEIKKVITTFYLTVLSLYKI